jgi:RimJ/RimL family protein N-acetyltransferase
VPLAREVDQERAALFRAIRHRGRYVRTVSGDARVRLPERIEGRGVLLKRWRESDAEAFATPVTESAEHLRPWVAWVADEPLSLGQRRAMLAKREQEWLDGGDVALAVIAEGQVAGGCGLHRRDPGTLEIGYWIHSSFLRRGLATAASALLTDAALGITGIDHVEIHHDKANVASGRVPQKLGFDMVGEQLAKAEAPGNTGVNLIWRMDRSRWTGSPTQLSPSM